jgi:hypothetical protein
VVGVWQALSNQTPVTITIKRRAINAKCPEINGTILDSVSVETQTLIGFYCPDSGRIVFSRTQPGQPTQVYSANLSEIGPTLHMGGSFEQTGVGEYAFFASK